MGSRLELVRGAKVGKPERRKFFSGEIVPQSGIYRITHAEHRLPHEVTVLSGQMFPPCAKCGNAVSFQLMRVINDNETPFNITLHQIPEIATEEVSIAQEKKVG